MSNRAHRAYRNSSTTYLAVSLLVITLIAASSPNPICGEEARPCRQIPPTGFDDSATPLYSNEYINSVYEYAVSMPDGLKGYSSPPPTPSHGFGILLGRMGEGYIWVDGSWNSLEYESSQKAALGMSIYLKKNGAAISHIKFDNFRLGDFSATRMVAEYRCSDSNELFVRDQVFALSSNKSKIWEAGLDTRVTAYNKDRGILDSILKSWRYYKPKLN